MPWPCAVLIPETSSFRYITNNPRGANQPPGAIHWFGADQLGRGLFVRVFFGARYSILIGVAAALVNLVIGVAYGGVSGFVGGRLDNALMRVVGVLYSVPLTICVIVLMAFLNKPGSGGSEIGTIILAFCISYWIDMISYWIEMARVVRGEVLQLKRQEFVLAAKA